LGSSLSKTLCPSITLPLHHFIPPSLYPSITLPLYHSATSYRDVLQLVRLVRNIQTLRTHKTTTPQWLPQPFLRTAASSTSTLTLWLSTLMAQSPAAQKIPSYYLSRVWQAMPSIGKLWCGCWVPRCEATPTTVPAITTRSARLSLPRPRTLLWSSLF